MSDTNDPQFTEPELDAWFEAYGGERQLARDFITWNDHDDSYVYDPPSLLPNDVDIQFAVEAFLRLGQSDPLSEVDEPWTRLSTDAKRAFRRGVDRLDALKADLEIQPDESVLDEMGADGVVEQTDSVIDELGGDPVVIAPDVGGWVSRVKGAATARWIAIGAAAVLVVVVASIATQGGDPDEDQTATEQVADGEVGIDDDGTLVEEDPATDDELAASDDEAAFTPGPEWDAVARIGGDEWVVLDGPEAGSVGDTVAYRQCRFDASGEPVAGAPVFVTIGDDPAGPDATHNDTITGDDGCADGNITLPSPGGSTSVFMSDGADVFPAGTIDVGLEVWTIDTAPDLVSLDEIEAFTDDFGAVWLEATPTTPWPTDGPKEALVYGLNFSIWVDPSTDEYANTLFGTTWSLTAGESRGEATYWVDDQARGAVVPEWYVTADGTIVLRLLDPSVPGEVVTADDLGPDATMSWSGAVRPTLEGEWQSVPGEVIQIQIGDGGPPEFPDPSWTPLETDSGPVVLTVPSGDG